MAPKVFPGRIINYILTDNDVNAIEIRRQTKIDTDGELSHKGNPTNPGDVVVLLVTKAFDDGKVNGKLLLDGTDTHWVTSISPAAYDEDTKSFTLQQGTWFLPQRY